jgi:hypothetical protein
MSNVLMFKQPGMQTDIANERLCAMMDRNAAKLMLAIKTAHEYRKTQDVLPSGNFAVIEDQGERKTVQIFTNEINLVDGPMTVSEFTESTSLPLLTRRLTKAHRAQDIGSYADFTQKHDELWKFATGSRYMPMTGLAMVQAMEFVLHNNIWPSMRETDAELARRMKSADATPLDDARDALDRMIADS